jgi:hypothetical protein
MSVLSRIAYYQDRRDEMPNQELARELVTDYAGDFVRLRRSKNNRLVWGSMIALSTVALLRADEIYQQVGEIKTAMGKRSIITVVSGVKILALVATKSDKYKANLFPYLLNHLATCRPKMCRSTPRACCQPSAQRTKTCPLQC